jgi:transglutaminase-like putative cysteine protease
MLIKAGFDIVMTSFAPTPLIALLSVHPSRNRDLRTAHHITIEAEGSTPSTLPAYNYTDTFGNVATRVTLPAGRSRLRNSFVIEDCGLPDHRAPEGPVTPINELPEAALPFLFASRYCETERLMQFAWNQFGGIASARGRIEAIVDWVHHHIRFGYQFARRDRTAWDGYQERVGVCRDFAHLAVTLCRCVNIPARYCTGYLGDIGVPAVDAPMDFSAWFEAFVDGGWYTYDARHNTPRIGRIVMARGRDATDVAITTAFGGTNLEQFHIVTDQVNSSQVLPGLLRAA